MVVRETQENTIWVELLEGIRPRFLFAILGVTVCLCFDSLDTLKMTVNNPLIYQENSSICVLYFYFNAVSFGGVFSNYFMTILAAIPFAASYSIEQNSRFFYYKISRCKRTDYYISKIGVAALYGGMATLLGSLLFILALSTYMPLVTPAKLLEMTPLPYYDALVVGNGKLYFAIVLFLAFLSGALWGSTGMCASAFIPNPYVAVCSPFIIKFFLVELGRLLKLPAGIRLDLILNARGSLVSDSITLMIATIWVISIILIYYRVFSHRVERRLDDGA